MFLHFDKLERIIMNTDETPEEKKPIGWVDDNQINAWKSVHKQRFIHEIVVNDDDDEPHVTYLRKPNLENLQMLASYAKKDKEIEGLKLLFNTIRIGGSEEVKEDPEMYLAAMSAAGQLFKKKEAQVKKR